MVNVYEGIIIFAGIVMIFTVGELVITKKLSLRKHSQKQQSEKIALKKRRLKR